MEVAFSPADLAAAGLVLDICGAAVLARGLFQSNREIVELASTDLRITQRAPRSNIIGSRFMIGHPTLLLCRVEDRVDALLGMGMLCLGFLNQGMATILMAGGATRRSGGSVIIVALCIAAITAAFVLSAYLVARRPLVGRILSRVLREPGIHPNFADAVRRQFRDGDRHESAQITQA